jgi:hypothetical protein
MPIALAERAFRERPYSQELFAAARAYSQTLLPHKNRSARSARRKLEWILWHDLDHPLRDCWSSRIRTSLAAMDPNEAFAWQWLLRNTAAGSNAAPGKAWVQEACRRLDQLGEPAFITRTNQWLRFPNPPVRLSPAGAGMLRLIVWYGWLVDRDPIVEILGRLARVRWADPESARMAIASLAGLLRSQPDQRYRGVALRLCRGWAGSCDEVKLLEKVYDPARAARRNPRIGPRSEELSLQFERLQVLAGTFLGRLA